MTNKLNHRSAAGLAIIMLGIFTCVHETFATIKVLDTMESKSAWTAQGATLATSTNHYVGNYSLVMGATLSSTATYPGIHRNLTYPGFNNYQYLTFWLYTNHDITYFDTFLEQSNGLCIENVVSDFYGTMVAGKWHYVIWPYQAYPGWVHNGSGNQLSSSINWSTINFLQFYVDGASLPANSVNYYIDQVSLMTYADLDSQLHNDANALAGNENFLYQVNSSPAGGMMTSYFNSQIATDEANYPVLPTSWTQFYPWQANIRAKLAESFAYLPQNQLIDTATYTYSQNFSSGAAGFDQTKWVWPDGYEVGNVGPDLHNAFVVQGGGLDGYPAYCSNGRAANAYTAIPFGPGTTVVYQMMSPNLPLFGSGFLDCYTGDNDIDNLIGFRADQAGNDYFVNFDGTLYDTGISAKNGIKISNFLIDWEATSVRFAIDPGATGTYKYDHTFTTGIPATPANFDIFQNAGGRVILMSVSITSTSAVLGAVDYYNYIDSTYTNHPDFEVHKVAFKSWADHYVTGVLYIPIPCPQRVPAVLNLLGHGESPLDGGSSGAQARGLSLVKAGFVALTIDTYGNGQEAETYFATYDQECRPGLATWMTDTTTSSLIIADAEAALDFLCTLPQVDPNEIGVTGVSGGSFYSKFITAVDSRVKACVPVCCLGPYSVLPDLLYGLTPEGSQLINGVMTYAESADLFALGAPAATLLINPEGTTSLSDMMTTYNRMQQIYTALGISDHISYYNDPTDAHGYFQPGRQAAVGWFKKWLMGIGDGSPVTEPNLTAYYEPANNLKVWPDNSKPSDFENLKQFIYDRSQTLVAQYPVAPARAQDFEAMRPDLLEGLTSVLRDVPAPAMPTNSLVSSELYNGATLEKRLITTEPNISIALALNIPNDGKTSHPVAILTHVTGKASDPNILAVKDQLLQRGWTIALADIRGTGETYWNAETGSWCGMRDMDLCSYALNLNHTIAGLWCYDMERLIDYLVTRTDIDASNIAVVGFDDCGVVDIFAAAIDSRIKTVATVKSLGSYVWPGSGGNSPDSNGFVEGGFGGWYQYGGGNYSVPFANIAAFVPQILTVGDIPQFVACVSPRRVLILDPLKGDKTYMSASDVSSRYGWPQTVFSGYKASQNLSLMTAVANSNIATTVANWIAAPPQYQSLSADYNHDNYVNFMDLSLLAQCWLSSDASCAYMDYHGAVPDFSTFSLIASEWLQCTVPTDPNCW